MKAISVQLHNSNNGLGYGGKVGRYTFYDNGLRVFRGKICFEPSLIGKSASGEQLPPADVVEWAVLFNDTYIHISGKPSPNVYIHMIPPIKEPIPHYTASFNTNHTGDFKLVKTIPFTLFN